MEMLEEYQPRLDEIDELIDGLEFEIKESEKKKKELKVEAFSIFDRLFGAGLKASVDCRSGRCIQRRISDRSVVDLYALEQVLGSDKFRKLLCDERVVYEISDTKLEQARSAGKITDEMIKKVTTEKFTESLYRPKTAKEE